MLSKYLDPKNDYAFKRIFGRDANKQILIQFLNDMISFKEGMPIVDITYLKPIQDPEISSQKTSIVDILCKDEKGNQYIVEMQVAREKGFIKRAQYYAAKAYCNQAEAGSAYHDLKEVIFLAITEFVMFPDKESFKSDHIILDKKTHTHDLKGFSFTFLELPKFNKSEDDLLDMIDKWCYFFKYAKDTDPESIKRISKNFAILPTVFKELDRAYWTKDELFTYEDTLKKEKDLKAAFDQQYDDGIAKGIELGIEKGKEQGILEAKLETARKMKEIGLSIEQIADVTGLSIKDLKLSISDET
ncbi:MAG: hypothetical protein HEEMFOPI_00094 [Holosporales bacterium]